MPVVCIGAASDGRHTMEAHAQWQRSVRDNGQKGQHTKKQCVPADGQPHKRLAQVRAKLGEPPAELINQLKLDGSAAPEEWTHLPCRHEPAP